jgi:hypothetical protein
LHPANGAASAILVDTPVTVGIPAMVDFQVTVGIREMLCMAATRRMVVIPDLVDIQVPPAIPVMGNIPGMADTQATEGIQAKTTEDIPAITATRCMAGIPETAAILPGEGIRNPAVVDTRVTAAIPDMACPPVTADTQDMLDTLATTVTPATWVIQEIRRATKAGVVEQGALNLLMVTARTMAAVIQTRH